MDKARAYTILFQLSFSSWIKLITGGTIFLLTFLISILLTKTINKQDINNLREMESKVKEYCSKAELAHHDTSGNRWILLVLNGNPCENELRQMQRAYKEGIDACSPR